MRSKHQQRVDEFMRLADQELPKEPTMPPEKIRKLRARLILEEAVETIAGLGLHVVIDEEYTLMPDDFNTGFISFSPTKEGPNIIEVADGCADLKVVTTGTLSACGIDDEELQVAVDENNLAKFGPGGHRGPDGKWIKPPNHEPPDIQTAIFKK